MFSIAIVPGGQMLFKKKVDFKGTKNGIILHFSDDLSFSEIMIEVEKKLKKANNFFAGAHIIGVDGPVLTLEQESELTDLIQRVGNMKVLTLEPIEKAPLEEDAHVTIQFDEANEQASVLQEDPGLDHKAEDQAVHPGDQEAGEPVQVTGVPSMDQVVQEAVKQQDTVFHRGTLRSGRRIDADGHIIVLGDVNPGAELYAGGNIVVFGSLRGFVHAGKHGDDSALVLALKLQPTQLRIGEKISRPPDEGNAGPDYPEIAVVKENQIIIEPY